MPTLESSNLGIWGPETLSLYHAKGPPAGLADVSADIQDPDTDLWGPHVSQHLGGQCPTLWRPVPYNLATSAPQFSDQCPTICRPVPHTLVTSAQQFWSQRLG